MEKQIIIHIRLEKELHEQVSKKAKELGLTVSSYVRMLLSKEVK